MGMDHTIECKKRVPEALVEAIASVKLGKTPGTINVSTPKGLEFVVTYSPDRGKMVEALKIVRDKA